MPIFNLPETVQIPFDALSNEQRAAIHTVMSGDGLVNPLSDKIQKCREAIRHEINIFNGFQLAVADDGGGCVECPISGCPTLIGQQRVEIMYQLELLLYWLDVLELHTDKLSGSSVEYIDNFFQRLSTAGAFSSAMKSVTGQNKEKFSYVFHSLMGSGDNCLDRILNAFWGNCTEGPSFCGSISTTSGVVGLAQGVCTSDVAQCVISSFLPSLIQCLKDLIDEDDLNYCEAKKIVDKYAAAQRLTSDSINDPIMGAIVKSLFATPALSDALRQIQDEEFSDEFTQSTADFFPEFTDETGRIANCEGAPLVVVGDPGPKGDGGLDGCKGPQGLPGAPGIDGECYEPNSPCGGTQGACCVNGFCLEVTESQCAFYNGNYYGDNFPCEDTEDCVPTGCGNDAECEDGKVCCGGQCTTPCANGQANGGGCNNCPPCAPCADCTTGCGGVCDCGAGKICCNDVCTVMCPNGGCPNCQGGCCPAGFVCCGGDGCCLEEACLNGSCCDGPISCGDDCCEDNGNGLGCCGDNCPCDPGERCCNGGCCDAGAGGECCAGGCPCSAGQECCDEGCRDIVVCESDGINLEVYQCETTEPCGECPTCCDPLTECAFGGCCEPEFSCCSTEGGTTPCCEDGIEDCVGICGCCPKFNGQPACCVDGECVPKCNDGGCPSCGEGIGADCCEDFINPCGGEGCQTDCKPDDSGCCSTTTPYYVESFGGCVAPCPCEAGNLGCPPAPDPSQNCNGGCPCENGLSCCPGAPLSDPCCDLSTHYCGLGGACLPQCSKCSGCPDSGSPGGDCPDGCETLYTGQPGFGGFGCDSCCTRNGGTCCNNASELITSGAYCLTTGDADIAETGCCPEGSTCEPSGNGTHVPQVDSIQCCPDDTFGSIGSCGGSGQGKVCCGGLFSTPSGGECGSPYDDRCKPPSDNPQCGPQQTTTYCSCCPVEGTDECGNTIYLTSFKIGCRANGTSQSAKCRTLCEDSQCADREPQTGACCTNGTFDGCLDDLTLEECTSAGGTPSEWFEGKQCGDDDVICLSQENEPCLNDSSCYSGAFCCDFGGGDLKCTSSTCPEIGQCCYERFNHDQDYPYCIDETRTYCNDILGGEFTRDKLCDKNGAATTGEDLCLPENFCDNDREDCADYDICQDNGCECESNECKQIGSCCKDGGVCDASTKFECESNSGTWTFTKPVCKGCQDNGSNNYFCFNPIESELGPGPHGVTDCDCERGVCCTEDISQPIGPNRYQCNVGTDAITGLTRQECDELVAGNANLVLTAWKTCQNGNSCNSGTCIPTQGCCVSGGCYDNIPVSSCTGNNTVVWGGCTDPVPVDSEDCYVPPDDWCCCCNANLDNPGAQPLNQDGQCDDCCQRITGVEYPDDGVECGHEPAQCDCDNYSGDIDCGCPEIACCLKVRQNYGLGCQRNTVGGCAAESANRLPNLQSTCEDDACCPDACPRGACCFGESCSDGYLEKWCEIEGGVWVENTTGEADFCTAVKPCDDGPGEQCEDFPNDPGGECGACCDPCQQSGGGPCTLPTPCFITTRNICIDTYNGNFYQGQSCGAAGCNIITPDPGFWCCCNDPSAASATCKCQSGAAGDSPCEHGGIFRLGVCSGGSGNCACPACCGLLPGGGGCVDSNPANLLGGGDPSTIITDGPNTSFNQPNLPLSPCQPEQEFCVDTDGNGKCCGAGTVCFNGTCVDQPQSASVVAYSSVRGEYFYCPEGFCNTLDVNGRAVCKDATSSNCPELQKRSGNTRLVALSRRITKTDRTYSAFQTFTRNKDVILQSKFDSEGRLENYFIEVKENPVVGRQNELARTFTIGAVTTEKDREQQVVTAPIKFQIINYVADDKIKIDARPSSKRLGATDTKSKISKAELRDSKAVGQPGAQVNGVDAQTIDGSLTAVIGSNGVISDSQVVTFVSGSNIRLDTNDDANIIRISVDDLNLWELVDVDDGVSAASNNDLLQYDSSAGLWKAVALDVGATGATGVAGPIGGSDGQVLFNDSGGASGDSKLTYNNASDTLTVGTGVTTNLLGGMSAGGASDFNDNTVKEAKLVDYSEKINAIGTISTSPYIINIENGNVQTFTAGGNFTAAFTNPPASGAAGSLTLIITNGGAHTITWPSAVKWSSGVAPTLTSSGTDILSFTTIDGGTNWYGFVGGLGFA